MALQSKRRRLRRLVLAPLLCLAAGTVALAVNSTGADAGSGPGLRIGPTVTATPTATAMPTATPAPKRVRVPRLAGLRQQTALARARRRGFDPAVSLQSSRATSAGVVSSERPKARTLVAERAPLLLTVPSGPPPVAVPRPTGLSVTDA